MTGSSAQRAEAGESSRPSAGALWTVAAVARRLGVSPSTLRSWSLRYGIGPAGHQPGRYRRYSEADVAELDLMRGLVEQGMALSAAAELARARRAQHGPGPPGLQTDARSGRDRWEPLGAARARGVVRILVTAARRVDLETATGIVSATLARHGLTSTWDGVCRPALVALDSPIDGEGACVEAELLLSWAVSTALRRHCTPNPTEEPSRRTPSAAVEVGPVLLAATAGEQHTLALEALLAALGERGIPARMLGGAVPHAALREATETLRPSVVVVWSQRPGTATPAAVRAVRRRAGVVVAAGPGWAFASLPPAVVRVGSLVEAVEAVEGVEMTGTEPHQMPL